MVSVAPWGSPANVPLTALVPVLSMIVNDSLPVGVKPAVASSVAPPRFTWPETANWL